MRQRRTIYFNDARHYYLFVHEPPMRLADAWSAVDEVAGTGVDTFAYGVARDDGLFYPSRVGQDLVSSLCIEAVEILVNYDTYPSAGMASRQVDP